MNTFLIPGDPNELISEEEFCRRLLVIVHTMGSQAVAAKRWGVSESYLSDVLTGRRQPGKKILNAVSAERVVMYRQKKVQPWRP